MVWYTVIGDLRQRLLLDPLGERLRVLVTCAIDSTLPIKLRRACVLCIHTLSRTRM
jgi:hypothetical protein